MRLVLDFWNRRWQTVSYDPATGAGRVRWFARRPKSSAGWAYRYNGQWFAVWKKIDLLVFQVENRQWPLGTDVDSRLVDSGTIRRFTLSRSSRVEFELDYEPIRHKDDPTFDDFDDEMEDFFLWLSRLWEEKERQETMLRQT